MWFNASVCSPFSPCQSVSLSGATSVFSVPPSLLLSYPVSHLPFLCTWPLMAVLSSPLVFGFSSSFTCRLFPLATCVWFLPHVHVLPVLAMLSSLMGFPALMLSSSVSSCHSHGSAPASMLLPVSCFCMSSPPHSHIMAH